MPRTDQLPADLNSGLFNLKFKAMGTQCQVLYRTPSLDAAKGYRDAAMKWVHAFEAKYSRFREDSLISAINRAAGKDWVDIDEDAERVLGFADTIAFLSKGVLDPTSLPLTWLWKRCADSGEEPSEESIESARALVGWNRVERVRGRIRLPEKGMALDLGGYGKELAVDTVAEMAEPFGIQDVLVDFGRDIRALGQPADGPVWVIGVEDGGTPGDIWERIAVSNKGVASSGNYRRYVEIGGKSYGHLIDVRTGWPVRHDCQGVTVVADRCFDAGILATTAFIIGPHDGLELLEGSFGVEGCLQTTTRKMETRLYHGFQVPEE